MIAHWLVDNRSQKLIIFCNGWGMDHHPLAHLGSADHDVLILSDYTSLDVAVDIDGLGARYGEINLICWSFGVWAGPRLFVDAAEMFTRKIAVNGTMRPIDDRYGIPRQFFEATLDHFSVTVRDRFYRRMCRPVSVLELFLENSPRRSVINQKAELDKLAGLVARSDEPEHFYDTAIIASRDLIIPTVNQLSYWQGRCPIVNIEGCHYPFAGWRSWSDILAEQ